MDKEGNWLTVTWDNAMYFPIMEMSCGKVLYLPEITYQYNTGTGMNDYAIYGKEQAAIKKYIRRLPKY